MRRLIYALLLLQLSFTAAADTGSTLEKLYSALNMLNQQQLAVYQRFQMVQEVRRSSSVPMLYSMPMPPQPSGQIPNYDAVVAAHQKAIQREEDLSRQAEQLLAKYNEIEEMKAPIQSQIYELTLKAGQDGLKGPGSN